MAKLKPKTCPFQSMGSIGSDCDGESCAIYMTVVDPSDSRMRVSGCAVLLAAKAMVDLMFQSRESSIKDFVVNFLR